MTILICIDLKPWHTSPLSLENKADCLWKSSNIKCITPRTTTKGWKKNPTDLFPNRRLSIAGPSSTASCHLLTAVAHYNQPSWRQSPWQHHIVEWKPKTAACGSHAKPRPPPPTQEAPPAASHGAHSHRITVASPALVHPPPLQSQGHRVALLLPLPLWK